MTSILLNHHNKLGDHLILNGAVREVARACERVGIFCQPQYRPSVAFMFRDLENLAIETAPTHRSKQYFLWRNRLHLNPRHYDEIRELYDDLECGVISERQFYQRAGVPFEKKWDGFHVPRDLEREELFFADAAPRGPYIFVHDDARYPLDHSRLHPSLPVARPEPGRTNIIFDYGLIIERAQEIHVVDSAFMFLVELLPYRNPEQKLFVHRYARKNLGWNLPVLKKPWIIHTS